MSSGVIRKEDLRRGIFDNWNEAAQQSHKKKAVGQIVIDHRGRLRKVEIIKSLEGDGIIHYPASGVVIRKATSQEIDSCKKWKPW